MEKKSLSQLVKGFQEPDAEQEVLRLGWEAVSIILNAFKTLDHYDSVKAEWYCLLLSKLNLNILKDICKTAKESYDSLSKEFAWLFRSTIYVEDSKSVVEELERCVGFSQEQQAPKEFYLSNYYLPAGLIEILGRSRYISSAPFLEKILDAHLKLFDPMKKDYFGLSGEVYLTASLATVLLSFTEQGYSSRFSTNKLAELAVNSYLQGRKNLINGPLPLLFIPSEKTGREIMERLVKNIKPVDPLLSDLYYWFKIADDFHLGKLPLMSGINPLNWLEVLEKNCDPKSYGPGCALFVRKKLDSGSADIQSIEHLSESKFSEEKFRLIMQAVNIEECNPFLLFLFCEVKFYFSAPEKTGDWKNVNKRLEFFNVNKVSDWSWIPLYDLKTPCGQKALDILIEQYSDLLSDPFIEFDKTKKIPAIFYLVKIRLLSGIVQKNNSSDFKSLENFIKSIRDKSILEASYEITFKIFDKNEELIKIYLEHPDVTEKSIFTENLVTNAVGFTGDFMKTALVDFAFREGWGTEKGDYGIWNKLTLYFAKVLEPRVIDKLVPLKGSSGLGSAFEIAIINLGERYSDKIDDFSFNTALFHLLSDGFTDYKLVFFENRCKKYLCELATSKNLNDVQIAAYGVSRIIDAKKTSFKITIDLLISFVLIIADAVSQARSNSGETWEDRNWGGYNMSGEESFAENISCAIKNLSILKYEKDDLDKLKKRLDFINLSNIVLVDATSYSIDYVAFDLEKALGL